MAGQVADREGLRIVRETVVVVDGSMQMGVVKGEKERR